MIRQQAISQGCLLLLLSLLLLLLLLLLLFLTGKLQAETRQSCLVSSCSGPPQFRPGSFGAFRINRIISDHFASIGSIRSTGSFQINQIISDQSDQPDLISDHFGSIHFGSIGSFRIISDQSDHFGSIGSIGSIGSFRINWINRIISDQSDQSDHFGSIGSFRISDADPAYNVGFLRVWV